MTAPLEVSVGPSPEMRVAQGRISVSAVPPGSYLARVSFAEGGAARGALIRPFRVLARRPHEFEAGDGDHLGRRHEVGDRAVLVGLVRQHELSGP